MEQITLTTIIQIATLVVLILGAIALVGYIW